MSKVFIEETTLTAIGDAIREKTGKTELIAPLSMATEISSITTGGGGDEDIEPIVLTGSCEYACAGAIAGSYIKLFSETISTNDITNTSYMFYKCPIERIPFEINCKDKSSFPSNNMFDSSNLEILPMVNNAHPGSLTSFCNAAKNLRTIPENFGANWNWDSLHTGIYNNMSSIFRDCYSLRKVPDSFISNLWGKQTTSYAPTRYLFCNCYSLDEVKNLPVQLSIQTSNIFNNIFDNASRLKSMTFATNEDGTAKIAEWKNQTINFNNCVGYVFGKSLITGFNAGITADKEVKDDATYQALKDNPDWFTTDSKYSRYNYDSAVETINSLPDTSAYLATAGGTNTIKFRGASGSLTDGGAINTMTEEEIAVATAKGWTVSFV